MATVLTVATLIGGAIVTGAGFVLGGQIIQTGEKGIGKLYNEIHTKIYPQINKEGKISELHQPKSINSLLTESQRQILKEVTGK